ncbi:MAG: glycosyltransferase family 4 protein [Armatimonadetes bacterium]|nr:glycosyltransferase family 4 protein [Armatimonadota bacterium]
MRIVLAHKYFYRGGGTATYIFALLEELQKRGHECIPFTVAYEQTVPREYWGYYVSPPAGERTTHLKDMKLSPLESIKLLGRATWSTEAYRQATRLVSDLKPDIAYVLNIYSYMSPSPIRAFRRQGLPILMRVADFNLVCPGLTAVRQGEACLDCADGHYTRGIKYRCHKGSLKGTAARAMTMWAHRWLRIYDDVDTFVTPSLILRDTLIRAGYPAEKVHHLPSFYPAPPAMPTSAGEEYVLYFGRVAPEKGLDVLVRALALMDSDVPVVVAGGDVDGETQRLQDLANSLGVKSIEFVGMKQRAELDELIRGCLFSVVPSKVHDNCPMSVLESFSHAKPVIGAAIGGIPEQITEDCGLLFEPGNPEAMAAQMQRLLSDADLRHRMGRGAYERLRTVYSVERHMEALLGHFEALCARRSSA